MAYQRNDFSNKKKGRKSFYVAGCAALVCLLAVGTVYYRTSQDARGDLKKGNQIAESPVSTPAGNGAIGDNYVADSGELKSGLNDDLTEEKESQQASLILNSSNKEDRAKDKKTAKSEKKNNKKSQKKEEKASKETMSNGTELTFQAEKGLAWPVKGEVIMKFSQTNNVYFATLAQYKSNPAIEISAKKGSKVTASAAGIVTKISNEEETGVTVTTNIGSNYTVVYGQLQDVQVKEGQKIQEGQLIGKIAEPTKYFAEEGSNLYFQVTQNNEAVDPLLLLN